MYTARFASSQLIIWTNDKDEVTGSTARKFFAIDISLVVLMYILLLLYSSFAIFVIYTQTGQVSRYSLSASPSLFLSLIVRQPHT